jgi:hypothetical protein
MANLQLGCLPDMLRGAVVESVVLEEFHRPHSKEGLVSLTAILVRTKDGHRLKLHTSDWEIVQGLNVT